MVQLRCVWEVAGGRQPGVVLQLFGRDELTVVLFQILHCTSFFKTTRAG